MASRSRGKYLQLPEKSSYSFSRSHGGIGEAFKRAVGEEVERLDRVNRVIHFQTAVVAAAHAQRWRRRLMEPIARNELAGPAIEQSTPSAEVDADGSAESDIPVWLVGGVRTVWLAMRTS